MHLQTNTNDVLSIKHYDHFHLWHDVNIDSENTNAMCCFLYTHILITVSNTITKARHLKQKHSCFMHASIWRFVSILLHSD